MKLSELKPGESGKVVKITAQKEMKLRLQELGITKGTEIEVVKYSPFGDPYQLRLRNFSISIRKAQCDEIEVEKNEQI